VTGGISLWSESYIELVPRIVTRHPGKRNLKIFTRRTQKIKEAVGMAEKPRGGG
jgi:hypothetical protein